MKKNKFIILIFIILYIFSPFFLNAQEYSDAEIKASYIYNFSKYVEWKDQKYFKKFKIGIYGDDAAIYSTLKNSSNIVTIKGVPLTIQRFKTPKDIVWTQVLYVPEKYNGEINKIKKKIEGRGTLLVTDNYLSNKSMINFVTKDNTIRFDINEEYMAKEKLKVSPQLIALFAKTKELKELYIKTEELLKIEKDTVEKQKEKIRLQLEEIKKQNNTIISQKKDIELQEKRIEQQKNKLNNLLVDIEIKEKNLNEKISLLKQKEIELKNQRRKLNELIKEKTIQKDDIIKQEKLIYEQEYKIEKQLDQFRIQDELLKRQKYDISVQKDVLNKQLEKIAAQRMLLYLSVFSIILILGIVFFIYRSYKTKKLANKRLEEKNYAIEKQKEEIAAQRDQLGVVNKVIAKKSKLLKNANLELSYKNKQITDSIIYAERIQNAILPTDDEIKNLIPNSFILYKPKDIVSGDFYWIKKIKEKIVVIAADCTGHGVSGAFMSLIGNSLLEKIVNENEIDNSAFILNNLRSLLIEKLSNTIKHEQISDGIDAAVVIIDYTNNTLQYSGAYNPIYLISDGSLEKIKGDRFPVGRFIKEDVNEFTNHIIEFTSGDIFYLSTDGYVDQFGGADNEKFYSSRLKKLLLDIHLKDIHLQKETLDNTIINWMGDFEQIDDILILGVRL